MILAASFHEAKNRLFAGRNPCFSYYQASTRSSLEPTSRVASIPPEQAFDRHLDLTSLSYQCAD